MSRIFDVSAGGVDFVITASNPDVAFDAAGPLPARTTAVGRQHLAQQLGSHHAAVAAKEVTVKRRHVG